MAHIKVKAKTKANKQEGASPKDDKKESGWIYKFSPHTVGQKNNYATFASIKEKIICRAQVELTQGYDVKISLEAGKYINFEDMKPELEIIDIKDIMAESDGVNDEDLPTYTPNRTPTNKEKRLLVLQERHNKAYDNALECLEDCQET